jgi:imidazolonepropionase-like amidohydrolase
MRALIPLVATLALLAVPGAQAGETLYIECGLVLPVDGDPIPDGRIVVRGGKVAEVGADVQRPPFSKLVDARHLTVTPGFVVPESRIGLPAPSSRPGRPGQKLRVGTSARSKGVDELYALHGDYELLLQQGVTTLGLLPVGSGAGVRGQVSAISTLSGNEKAMTVADEAAVLLDVDAHGPWREAIGGAFEKAADAIEKEGKDKAKKNAKKGARGKGGEKSKDALVRVLKGEEALFLLVDGGSTWTAAQDSIDFGKAKVTILEYGRAWQLVDDFKAKGVRVVTSPVLLNRPRSRMPVNRAAEYERAGVPFAFRMPSDSPTGASLLRDQAIEMARTGCSREAVLKALTLEPAKALGLGQSHGSVSKGRRADLLFWTAHPLDPLARLERILVAGEPVDLLPEAGFGDGA